MTGDDRKVPLYDMNREWPERRVPLSLAEIKELLAVLSPDGDGDLDHSVLDEVERKLRYHLDRFVVDVTRGACGERT